MTYASQDDLIARFGADELLQLTDPHGEAGAINAARVAGGLTDADRLIDGYCATRYALPLSPVPDLVVRLACDIARHRLHSDNPLEVVKDNYRDALRQLEAINAGRITLTAAGVETAEAVSAGVAYDTPMPRLAGKLGGF